MSQIEQSFQTTSADKNSVQETKTQPRFEGITSSVFYSDLTLT